MPLGPYKFERLRHRLGEFPRQPQPGIQPNRLPKPQGWGRGSANYWDEVFNDYLKGRKR